MPTPSQHTTEWTIANKKIMCWKDSEIFMDLYKCASRKEDQTLSKETSNMHWKVGCKIQITE